jgi:hypothetical protein
MGQSVDDGKEQTFSGGKRFKVLLVVLHWLRGCFA